MIPDNDRDSNKSNKIPPSEKPPYDFKNSFFNSSARDVVAYVLLLLGIILMFFQPIYGGLLIGIVLGVYFSKEIFELIKNLENFIETQGVARSLVLAGVTLAFFIAAPAIFIGAALVIAIKMFITPS